MKLNVSWQC
uniref:Uncharacterized protein n=1 Tax=Anguilla anguilla TaxID=7936 RepID=A0A0E9XRQ8_ANGAN